MVLPLIGAAIGGISSIVGGAMQSAATRDANQKNYEAQKEFAKEGLRWKVEDAKKAGIHPVYAVGAPTQSFSPSFVGDTAMGQSMASAGQDIGRAVATTATGPERQYQAQMASLALDRASLENELLRTQIRRQVVETGPSFPVAGGEAVIAPGVLRTVAGDLALGPHSTAQQAETEYGEVVGDVHGISRWLHDVSSAAGSWINQNQGKRPVRVYGEPDRAPPVVYDHLGPGYSRTMPR